MKTLLLLLIPVIGGVAGWLIISGGLKLLFWPCQPTKTPLNITFRGLLPTKQVELASGVRQMVETGIKSAVAGEPGVAPEILDAFTGAVVKAARERLEIRIPGLVPARLRNKIASIVEEIIRREIPGFVAALADRMAAGSSPGTDICRLVEESIINYDLSELEDKLTKSSEILWIKTGAAAVGFTAGLLQLVLAVLAGA